jgi:hypothetical protein
MLKKLNWLNVAQFLVIGAIALIPIFGVQAQLGFSCPPGLNCNAGTNVNSLIRTVINWVLSITLGIAVLFVIIGGFRYITAQGNESQATEGRQTVINALIGIAIIVLSYVIVTVVANLVTQTGGVNP